MTIRCLIVDDEIHARRVLEKYIHDLPQLELVQSCKNAIEAMEALRKHSIDLMFLDINMPKLTGLNFLESLSNPPLVVITTAYREYAVDAFDLDVIDYLHKPIPFPRFIRAVNKIEEKLMAQNHSIQPQPSKSNDRQEKSFIFVKADKKTIKLNFKDICYIEGLGDYIKIHTAKKTIISKLTIKKMEELLASEKFPRIHKSFIVALDRVEAIEGNQVEIMGMKLPIGQIYRQAFMEVINSYLKK
ncbi:MAG: LytR/AlgR family response regulator transcription factor [Marinifilaceae bacterium]|jgi:DNA-binding LytR/AlgR family response regulator